MQQNTFPRVIPSGRITHLSNAWALWNRLGVEKLKYDQSPYTYKYLAMDTWLSRDNPSEALGSAEYDRDKDFWEYLIKKVVKYAQETVQCRITFVPGKDKQGRWVTKVCRSCRRYKANVRKRQDHKVSVGKGVILSAIREDEVLKLGMNVPEQLVRQIESELPSFLTDDQKKQIASQFVESSITQMRIQHSPQETAQELMRILNGNPDIKAIDQKMKDEYADESRAFGEADREDLSEAIDKKKQEQEDIVDRNKEDLKDDLDDLF